MTDGNSLAGHVALVTGATSGLGAHFARLLARHGAAVAVTGRRVDRLEALVAGIEADGGRVAAIPLDVTDRASITACFDAAEATLGPVAVLVNNAGMNVQAMAADLDEAGYDRLMDTNVKGAFFCAQEAGRRMLARKQGGRIINIASIGAFTVLPGLVAYCMSKAAVAMMTKGLAREWARAGINVNALCPGYIRTELNEDWFASEHGQKQIASFPRKRLGQESDLDGTLLLLAGPLGAGITGSLFTVDDGQSL